MEIDPYDELTAYQKSAVLMAGAETGVFHALSDEVAPASAIAEKANLAPPSTRRLLRALAANGYVTKTLEGNEPLYAHNNISRSFVQTGAGGYARVAHKEALFYKLWGKLSAALTTQKAGLTPFAERLETDPNQIRLFLTALNDLADLAAPGVFTHINLSEDKPIKILDAGGGAGGYAAHLATNFPNADITLLDREAVLPLAEETLASKGLLDRVERVVGNLQAEGLGLAPGSSFDCIFLSHVLHDYEPTIAQSIVEKVAQLVAPGGSLYVLDVFEPEPNQPDNPVEALFDLMMLVENPGGLTHPASVIEKWISDAGLQEIQFHKLYFGSLLEAKLQN
ncbi:MAG: methyltransferase [Verrucomicrobiota bacterium]